MDQNQDFSQLRNLVALQKTEMPQDTQIDAFLIEFHRRQRAQLLKPASPLARAWAWAQERIESFELVPTLSYSGALAAVALIAFIGFSQQVQVTQAVGQPYALSFRMQSNQAAFAMIPSSFSSVSMVSPKVQGASFSPSRAEAATTRFVLANNSSKAYDATVAF